MGNPCRHGDSERAVDHPRKYSSLSLQLAQVFLTPGKVRFTHPWHPDELNPESIQVSLGLGLEREGGERKLPEPVLRVSIQVAADCLDVKRI